VRRVAGAHAQRLRPRLQLQVELPRDRAADALHRVHVDDDASVHLPEDGGVEPRDEILQRRRDQRLAGRRDDGDVLVVGAEVADLVDGDEVDLASLQHRDPLQPLAARAALQLLEKRAEVGGRLAQSRTDAAERLREAAGLDRLEQVVDRALLERLDGVLIERGDEDDVAPGTGDARDFDAREAWHLHVEEKHLGASRLDLAQRRDAVVHRLEDAQLGPQARQLLAQFGGEQRLVFNDQGGRRRHGCPAREEGRGRSWPCRRRRPSP
jgi:hypothetical protein